jgi:hypothetical protein
VNELSNALMCAKTPQQRVKARAIDALLASRGWAAATVGGAHCNRNNNSARNPSYAYLEPKFRCTFQPDATHWRKQGDTFFFGI